MPANGPVLIVPRLIRPRDAQSVFQRTRIEADNERQRQASVRARARAGRVRIAQDVEGVDLSGVSGTPTFCINGRRHHGAYDIDTLSQAVPGGRGAGEVGGGLDRCRNLPRHQRRLTSAAVKRKGVFG